MDDAGLGLAEAASTVHPETTASTEAAATIVWPKFVQAFEKHKTIDTGDLKPTTRLISTESLSSKLSLEEFRVGLGDQDADRKGAASSIDGEFCKSYVYPARPELNMVATSSPIHGLSISRLNLTFMPLR